MEDLLEINLERNFHDIASILNINVNNEILTIDVKSKQQGDSWIATFQASCLKKQPPKQGIIRNILKDVTAYIDIHTCQDIEQIKNKKAKQNQLQTLKFIIHYLLLIMKQDYKIKERNNLTEITQKLQALLESKKNESNPLELINEQSAKSNLSCKTSQKLKQLNSNYLQIERVLQQKILKNLMIQKEKDFQKDQEIQIKKINKMEASCKDLHNIDESLNKLNNLLQKAKNQ